MRMTRVKVCGITRPEDAELAVQGGAWALGFILWPRSPRAADPAVVAGLVAQHRRKARTVGVFVDPTLDEVAHAVEFLGVDTVQLHGNVGASFCDAVRRRTGAPVIRAFKIGSRADVQDADRFREVDFHLFDTRVTGKEGGTGETWDWSLAKQRRSQVPLILSGGLTADTVADGIAATDPYAVDVASGVEASPGVKDPEKLTAFLQAAGAGRVAA
jgi:phosphoribosylanthranilate isomerase